MRFLRASYPQYRLRVEERRREILMRLTLTFEDGAKLDLAYRAGLRSWHQVCPKCQGFAWAAGESCSCGSLERNSSMNLMSAQELFDPADAAYVIDSWLTDAVGLVAAAEHTSEVTHQLKFVDNVSKAIGKSQWMHNIDPSQLAWPHRRLARLASGYRDRVNRRRRRVEGYRL